MSETNIMISSLTELLLEEETLIHPIFGLLEKGGVQHYCYFAFTQNHFLIAYVSGKRIVSFTRIPLEIQSVKIKWTRILRQCVIDIQFDGRESFRITASPKVLTIDSQKENLPRFLEHLQSKVKRQALNLAQIDGEPIRWQYFNTIIYIILSCLTLTSIIIVVTELKKGDSDIVGVFVELSLAIPKAAVTFITPLAVLSLLNRFFFGKTLAVVKRHTLYLDNKEIPLSDIKEIVYHPRLVSRHELSFSHATLVVSSKAGKDYHHDIVHFPVYGMRTIKKYNPDIKIGFDGYIWFWIFMPSVVAVLIPFFFE